MNGFVNIQSGLADLEALKTLADSLYIRETNPFPGVEITGLQSGDSNAVADANSVTIQAALDAGGTLELIIPDSSGAVDGVWYTSTTIEINANTTLSWVGNIQQLASAVEPYSDYYVMRVVGANTTLNNPMISQRGVQVRLDAHGTHACLAIYNEGHNCTVNDGILEWGGHNCFQGGRDNTVFNRTVFRDSGEHLIYASGTYSSRQAIGLTFNNCTIERPGNGEQFTDVECNHVQLRKFVDVTIDTCVIRGESNNTPGQLGINATDIDGLTVIDTPISDYSTAFINFRTFETSVARDLVMTNVVATPKGGNTNGVKLTSVNNTSIFNNVTVNSPYRIVYSSGGSNSAEFNNCRFNFNTSAMIISGNSDVDFDDCTFDASDSTASSALTVESGSSASFTGTQTKIDPDGGQPFNWSPIP